MKQQGIALILVLWMVTLLAIIATSLSISQRSGLNIINGLKDERQAMALLQAGIQFMMMQLEKQRTRFNRPDAVPYPADAQLRPWSFAGHQVWIGAIPEISRLDLNRGDEQLLAKLIAQVGEIDMGEAEAIRDAIIDWKDRDHNRRPNGAEDRDYQDRPMGARDDLFLSVEELMQVKGVSPELYKKLFPLLTVYSRNRNINPIYAHPDLLSALGIEGEVSEEGPLPSLGTSLTKNKGGIFRIIVEYDLPSGQTVQAAAVINMQRRTLHGYQMLYFGWQKEWHRGRANARPGASI